MSERLYKVPAPSATTLQGTAARFIQVAKSQVGYAEGPKDNATLYGAFTKVNYQPWCGSFLMWCANESGVKIPNVVLTRAGAQVFFDKKRWYDSPEVGDLVFMSFSNGALLRHNINHIGIVTKVNGDGTVDTIEGNTTVSVHGDERNGGEVAVKTRAYGKNPKKLPIFIVGFGRPDYAKSAATPAVVKVAKVIPLNAYPGHTTSLGDTGSSVKFIQTKLGVAADGIYGPVTAKVVKAFKDKKSITGEDGVGPLTWKAIAKLK